MLTKEINTIGLGSFFPKTNAASLEEFDALRSIQNYALFYTGRHAIKHVLTLLQKRRNIRKIWLPKYYCQHVTSWLKTNFDGIDTYDIDPFFENSTLNFEEFATDEDVVILNNFWGIYEYKIPTQTNRATFIEDHSHGWQSAACKESKADYCFASLRKTLPVPLGGILWQPNGQEKLSVDEHSITEDFSRVWNQIDKAMTLKQNFKAKAIGSVNEYLKSIGETESFLHHQYTVIPVEKEHKAYLLKYISKDYNAVKNNNFKYIIKKIAPNSEFEILKKEKHTSFGLELVFKHRDSFDTLKQHLIHNKIYPSELWPDNSLDHHYKYALNLHIDFRYTEEAMDYIAAQINSWNS
ncbi:hypothetical protein [Cellulophaga sp. L1A9]|uniref:hypothetical protein n=1 Tax=Cellulophaga sp. L1A9 TaxID=2686362 RepID=UPI00131CEE6B|nr:hypothetical protein [Cellulophaga sp. L1A9]